MILLLIIIFNILLRQQGGGPDIKQTLGAFTKNGID